MEQENKYIKIFEECGAILNGHFLLTSGLHSPMYVEKFRILENPDITFKICKDLSEKFKDDRIELVIGPVTGGILISYELAKIFKVKSIFTERVDKKMVLRRGFTIEKGQRILIAEDIVTTGGSIKEVIEVVKFLGGEIVGVAALVDRSGGKVDFGVPLKTVLNLDIEVYEPDNCPKCKKGIPLTKPGRTNK
jgi:orotate phosphoribosyltransferase